MKSLSCAFIVLSGLTVTLVGCSKDDDKPSIEGTYTLSQKNTSACVDQGNNINESKTCTATDCETLTISGDGTFSYVEVDNSITTSVGGTYIINANQITIYSSVGGMADVDNATFSLSGSQLILTFQQDGDGCIEVETFIRK
jgi:hypothetical protein